MVLCSVVVEQHGKGNMPTSHWPFTKLLSFLSLLCEVHRRFSHAKAHRVRAGSASWHADDCHDATAAPISFPKSTNWPTVSTSASLLPAMKSHS